MSVPALKLANASRDRGTATPRGRHDGDKSVTASAGQTAHQPPAPSPSVAPTSTFVDNKANLNPLTTVSGRPVLAPSLSRDYTGRAPSAASPELNGAAGQQLITLTEDLKKANAELADLKEENEMLREIEVQFWTLLNEREDLQRELDIIRSKTTTNDLETRFQQKVGKGSESGPGGKGGASASSNHNSGKDVGLLNEELSKIRTENDAMHSALEECLDLLAIKDHGGDILRERGPVATFLTWLKLQHDRANAQQAVLDIFKADEDLSRGKDGKRGGSAPRGDSPLRRSASPQRTPKIIGGAASNTLWEVERNALITELNALRRENRELKDELDQTDLSRLQALDDASRLQTQVETMAKHVTELRAAYAQVRARADQNEGDQKTITSLKVQLADSFAEAAELKSQLAQAKQLQLVGAASLAADAARIRAELAQREKSLPRGRSESPAVNPPH